MTWDDDRTREHVSRVETLLSTLDQLPHEAARTRAAETAEALVDLYGECLARIMERITGHPESTAAELADRLADDELVGHLLLVHDLHPQPVDQRVRRALAEAAAPQGRGGEAPELLGVDGGTARVRLPGTQGGCGSTRAALTAAVEAAVLRLAPEIDRVETVQDAAPQPLITVDALFSGVRRAEVAGTG
ncbi:NifU family protein [Streptomyces sp. NPDC092296]|uniref:NifU family protein n=1 Tax=Streptomyces sp. NPDC092296 TaxID=3366012 RepID=UPI00380A549B